MWRSDIFLKIVVEHEEEESAEKLADELCRNLKKLYGVRHAEVANIVSHGTLPSTN
ncbi:MAG: hypothetical protein NZV14_15995 [Bryobacteraceae bacterium]|nr:hypothetical protein [Bryobacteraceae bacterium]MDW8379663.1 hypothetical protein [Bryobacterales bacterium]